MTTFPFTRGPLEGPATFLSLGMFSNLPWSGIGLTSCSLIAASLRFATADMLKLYKSIFQALMTKIPADTVEEQKHWDVSSSCRITTEAGVVGSE